MSDWLSRQLAAAQDAYANLPAWQQTAKTEGAMSVLQFASHIKPDAPWCYAEGVEKLERELAEAKRSDVAQAIRASKAEAEVERAREDGFMNGFSGAWYSDGKYDEQYAAAWSRYQQEREGGEGR